jgi:hypothetical protein
MWVIRVEVESEKNKGDFFPKQKARLKQDPVSLFYFGHVLAIQRTKTPSKYPFSVVWVVSATLKRLKSAWRGLQSHFRLTYGNS